MVKEPKHRDWIKLHVKECLIGSMREDMTPDERSVWYDFLVLAGNSRVPGVLCSNVDQGFTTKRISQLLNTPEPLIKKCIKAWKGDRIEVDPLKRISILNWDKYQYTDYDRQKPYRQQPAPALKPEPVAKSNVSKLLAEQYAEKKAHQEAVSKMSPAEREADIKRLSDEWDKAHIGDPNFDENGEPVVDKQEMRELVAGWNTDNPPPHK